jgi:hypothetical protein
VGATIEVTAGGTPWRLLVDVKPSGEPRILREAIRQLQTVFSWRPCQYGVLAVPYVGPGARAVCADVGVGHVDLAGNCRLVFDRVFIERSGSPNPRIERRTLRSIFATRASRVLRVLLDDTKHPWQVQQLARAASVSLGLASKLEESFR